MGLSKPLFICVVVFATFLLPEHVQAKKPDMAAFMDKVREWFDMVPSERCKAKLLKKQTPEVRLDSPLDTVGYPFFDPKKRVTLLDKRAPLNKVGGHKQPIHIGAEDYIVQGSKEEIQSFLGCFHEYDVQASMLGADGHWTKDKPTCTGFYAQLQNTNKHQGGAIDIMMREGLDKIVGFIAPNDKAIDTIITSAENLLGGKGIKGAVELGKDIKDAIEKLREYLNLSPKDLKQAFGEAKKEKDHKKRFEIIVKALGKSDMAKIKKGWTDLKNIDPKSKITLTLTPYPKPDKNVRATFHFKDCKTSLSQVAMAFEAATTNTTLADAASKIKSKVSKS